MSGTEKSEGDPSTAQIEQELVRRAAACGVAVYAISDYLLPGMAGTLHRTQPDPEGTRLPAVLLGFGALNEASIREGVSRLSRAL
jgi:DNA-binding transcriptional MocR family regulator